METRGAWNSGTDKDLLLFLAAGHARCASSRLGGRPLSQRQTVRSTHRVHAKPNASSTSVEMKEYEFSSEALDRVEREEAPREKVKVDMHQVSKPTRTHLLLSDGLTEHTNR